MKMHAQGLEPKYWSLPRESTSGTSVEIKRTPSVRALPLCALNEHFREVSVVSSLTEHLQRLFLLFTRLFVLFLLYISFPNR